MTDARDALLALYEAARGRRRSEAPDGTALARLIRLHLGADTTIGASLRTALPAPPVFEALGLRDPLLTDAEREFIDADLRSRAERA